MGLSSITIARIGSKQCSYGCRNWAEDLEVADATGACVYTWWADCEHGAGMRYMSKGSTQWEQPSRAASAVMKTPCGDKGDLSDCRCEWQALVNGDGTEAEVFGSQGALHLHKNWGYWCEGAGQGIIVMVLGQ